MAEKPPWFDGAVGGLIQQVQQENKALVATIREENKHAFEALGAQIQDVKAEQEVQKKQIDQLQTDVKAIQDEQAKPSGTSYDTDFIPHEIMVTGFCTYDAMKTDGWTREMFTPLLKTLKNALPLELQGCVSNTIKTIGYKNLKFSVDIEGPHAREVSQRWQDWLKQSAAMDLGVELSDDMQISTDVDNIKVYCQRKPSREARDKLWGRMKAVAKHEFGAENVTAKGHPEYEVRVSWEIDLVDVLFGKIDRYGSGEDIAFGADALGHLGWSQEEADRRVRSFHY